MFWQKTKRGSWYSFTWLQGTVQESVTQCGRRLYQTPSFSLIPFLPAVFQRNTEFRKGCVCLLFIWGVFLIYELRFFFCIEIRRQIYSKRNEIKYKFAMLENLNLLVPFFFSLHIAIFTELRENEVKLFKIK